LIVVGVKFGGWLMEWRRIGLCARLGGNKAVGLMKWILRNSFSMGRPWGALDL
jgi:hypothetical protein